MNINREICITAHRAITEHVAILKASIGQNDNFELLRQQYELYNVCKYFLHILRIYGNVFIPTGYAAGY